MTEEATLDVLQVIQDEDSSRKDFDRARATAFADPSEMASLQDTVDELEAELKKGRGAEDGARLALTVGVIQWILGRPADALESLSDVKNTRDGAYVTGRCLMELGRFEQAAKSFNLAAARGDDRFEMAMLVADAERWAGNLDGALEAVREYQDSHGDHAELHYQKGRCLVEMGEYEDAMEELEQAVEIDPDHVRAAFRLAYLCELRGLNDLAVRYYERCAEKRPTYANALLNLGVLYEDLGRFQKALACYRRVLRADPMNERARLYVRDAEASQEMFLDEDFRRRSDRTQTLLLTPVSDFELSVRSRNCLAKMNVRCLGDLVRLTEQDLLTFKNFGETSLTEIKDMLRAKGLRFGMTFEETPPQVAETLAAPSSEHQDILSHSIEELDLSIRSRRAIEMLGVATIGDLCRLSESDLLQCKNFGQTSLNEIRRKLGERGLSLAPGA